MLACYVVDWLIWTFLVTLTDTAIVEHQISPTQDVLVPTSDISITVGYTIHIQNTTSQTFMLCLGTEQRCDPSSGGPAAFKGDGLYIKPGQTVDVTFGNAGDFTITCPTIHINDLKISVHESDSDA